MPRVVGVHAGDTAVIRNDDEAPPMIRYTFPFPGQTARRVFTAAGSETYPVGGVHAAAFHDVTSVVVAES